MSEAVRSPRRAEGRRAPRRRRRPRPPWRRPLAAVLGALVAIVAVAAALAGGADEGRAPDRVRVDVVDVSGLTADEVRRAIRHRAESLADVPVTIASADPPGYEVRATRASLDARPQIRRAVAAAVEPRGFGGRLLARLGLAPTREVPLRYTLDRRRLERLVDRVTGDLNRDPVPARLRLTDEGIDLLRGRAGYGVDPADLRERLRDLPERVEVAPGPLPPPISDEAAERARRRALAILAGPVQVTFQTRGVPIEPAVLREALRFRPRPPELAVTLDPDVLYEDIAAAFSAREQPARDASFRVEGASVGLIPSRIGRKLDMPAIAAAIAQAPPGRSVRARFAVSRPELTTEQARAMRITELVSEFTTVFPCCEARVANIQRAAEILDGTIIPAGHRFSLNDALGARTEQRGFVAAPQIAAGRLEDAVGGGVSQVATTFFNAAFFAGLEIVTHTPHQFYISRYPEGREATVSLGGPELVVANDWDAAVLISATATDTSITIRLFSTSLGRRVETETGERRDFTEPRVREVENPELEPGERVLAQAAGAGGFTVDYTRRVYAGDRLKREETFTWTYAPQDAFVEVGPEPEDEEDGEEREDGEDGERARTAPGGARTAPARTSRSAPAG